VNFAPDEPRRSLDPVDLEAIMAVPLFVKLPGQTEGAVDERPAQLTDVFATIVDQMGVAVPEPEASPHGVSLAGPVVARADRPVWPGNEIDQIPEVLDVGERVDADWATFDLAAGIAGAYRAGPGGALVGRAATAVGNEVSPVEVVLHDAEKWADVDPASPTVPSIAVGTAEGVVAGTPVVVALNGIFAGSGWVHDSDGAPSIRVPLDPARLVDGTNTIAVYTVD